MKKDVNKCITTGIESFSYSSAKDIETDCVALEFINKSNDVARVNGFPLGFLDRLIWNCNEGEILLIKTKITFDTSVAPLLYVNRRRYMKKNISECIETTLDFNSYSSVQAVETDCLDLLVVNKGAAVAQIGGLPLSTNDRFSWSANRNEIIKSKPLLTFGAGVKLAWVIRRRYL